MKEITENSDEHKALVETDPGNNEILIVPTKTSVGPGRTRAELPYTLSGQRYDDLLYLDRK